MHRCLALAAHGAGRVSPNPMVGAVVVHDGQVIGEGFHQHYGGPHAEVNAINSVSAENRNLISSATLYVNLEPCCTHGNTPPCTDLIIEHQIPRVVISMQDANASVNGKGATQLRQAGVDVVEGCMEESARWLNRRFTTYHKEQRPYVILKWAQSSDGFIGQTKKRMKISNSMTDRLVHKWRSEEDAVLVGSKTARIDNPRLTARLWPGSNPLRVVADRSGDLPADLEVFDSTAPTLVTSAKTVRELLNELFRRQVLSVLVEGGAKLLNSFLEANLWDEARVIISDQPLREGVAAPHLPGVPKSRRTIGTDEILLIVNR